MKRWLTALGLSRKEETANLDGHSISRAAPKLGNARMRLGLNGLTELSTLPPTALSPSAGDNERGSGKARWCDLPQNMTPSNRQQQTLCCHTLLFEVDYHHDRIRS